MITLEQATKKAENLGMKDTKQNNQRLIKAVTYLNNNKDKGRKGKAFELAVRSLLTPYSDITDIQASGKCDIRFSINDTTYHTEIKSESGEIAKFIGNKATFNKQDITIDDLVEAQDKKYIIYSIDATIENARFIKTEDLFRILLAYSGRKNSMINWIDSKAKREENLQGRMMVSVNPSNAMQRREYLDNAIQGIGISLKELVELRR